MAKSVNVYQVFLSSRFGEFEALRNAIVTRKDVILSIDAQIGDLGDSAARSTPPTVESVNRAKDADVVLLIIGDTYGTPPPGHDKSFVHLEFEAARQGRILAYRSSRTASSLLRDPRLAALVEDVQLHCTVASLDLTDINRAADQVLVDLRDELSRLEDATSRASDTPLAAPLGREILSTARNDWSDDQIGPLDRLVFGEPAERKATRESASLIGRADDQWNEACRAFRLRSADLTIEHLERALELRPLDGEARYWLARLGLGAPVGTVKYEEVAANAAVAAATLKENKQQQEAGLAHLVEAKAFRREGDYQKGLSAARHAVELLGGQYFEPNLELAYLAIACGLSLEAFDAAKEAFTISPPCLGPARNQFQAVDGGLELLAVCERRLAVDAEGHANAMRLFGQDLYDYASQVADVTQLRRIELIRRLEVMQPSDRRRWSFGRRGPAANQDDGVADEDPNPLKVIEPVEYGVQRSADKPAEIVRDGVSRAAENLERLRDLEALLQESAGMVHSGREVRNDVLGRLNENRRRFKQLCGAALACLFVVFLAAGSVPTFLLFALVPVVAILLGVATRSAVTEWQDNHDDLRADDRLVSMLEEAWSQEAISFDEFVRRYEEVHLVWRTYGPSPLSPNHVDSDINTQLRVRRIASTRVAGRNIDLASLAPDLRQLLASIHGTTPWSPLAATNPAFPADQRSASTSTEGASSVDYYLLGLPEKRTKPPSSLPAGRWMAYRRAGTGPIRIDGSRTADEPSMTSN